MVPCAFIHKEKINNVNKRRKRYDDERFGVIDSLIKVHYIPSMEENRFIVSVCEPIDFDDNKDYEMCYNLNKSDKNYFQNMDAMIVGEIVDCENSN